jgi:diguanylate cyclase (GGDEF)-like protein
MMQRLQHMADHDALTNLYNRAYFHSELERVVERAKHVHTASCALLYIDLDNFKYVNDTMGHAAGDQLLIEVAGLLRKRTRKGDMIARFGGDEFLVLLYDTQQLTAAEVAEAFRQQLSDYVFTQGGKRVDLACSVGIAMIGADTHSADDALAKADLACHLAKRQGRNQAYMFNPADEAKMSSMSADIGWSRRIREAIEHDRFTLVFQPIVETRSRKVIAREALIRMRDENEQLVMPAGFLPSAERFGLSTEIDKWVIRNAIRMLARQPSREQEICLSINLSAQTLTDSSICDLIGMQMSDYNLNPAQLMFEVTETVAISDLATAEAFLATLKDMGCKTALDDFGSGFTSFAYLKELPVDIIKMDGRYVKNMAEDPMDQAMVKSITDIVHVLGMRTVAEFVEDEACLKLLAGYGVDFAQGYYLGRPQPLKTQDSPGAIPIHTAVGMKKSR